MSEETKKLSLEPYKGTRDFYPEDQFVQNYIFSVWRKVVESYGYVEYNASILEETALYKAKSGEEIVNDQTYSFTDRGGRDVTIRPEMTPTVARMVAQKRKELSFPLRWYSIPNLFRYERPQRGRLREHWQLNVDLFGVDGLSADLEIISLAYDIMKVFGAQDNNFQIRINSRKFMNFVMDSYFKLDPGQSYKMSKLIDKKNKITPEQFNSAVAEIVPGSQEKISDFFGVNLLEDLPAEIASHESVQELQQVFKKLAGLGIKNAVFDPTLMRGFDYYTGTVFELYDTNPANPRAIFGGGRYDDLVGLFDVEKVSGIGFGWGDVTTRDYLETYGLLPTYKSSADIYVCHTEGFADQANELAHYLRAQGINAAVDLTERKVASQVKTADKQGVPFIVVVGEEEANSKIYKLKDLKQSKEHIVAREEINKIIKP